MQVLEIGKKSGKIRGQEDAGELRRQGQDEEEKGAERGTCWRKLEEVSNGSDIYDGSQKKSPAKGYSEKNLRLETRAGH